MMRSLGWLSLAFLLLVAAMPAHAVRRDPVFAEGAYDRDLIGHITKLSATIDPREAQLVASTAYTTGRELRREWQVVWPPGYQNYLVHQGKRKGGYCYQFANELLIRLVRLQLQTIQLHWAESFPGTLSEHNVIVVTPIGGSFAKGIILDNWRYGGRLVWGAVSEDPHYHWAENPGELARRWPRPEVTRPATATAAASPGETNKPAAEQLIGTAR